MRARLREQAGEIGLPSDRIPVLARDDLREVGVQKVGDRLHAFVNFVDGLQVGKVVVAVQVVQLVPVDHRPAWRNVGFKAIPVMYVVVGVPMDPFDMRMLVLVDVGCVKRLVHRAPST